MGFVAHVLIFLFMIPLVFGWLLLVAVPLGALAVGIAAAPFAIRHSTKPTRKRVLIVEDDDSMKTLWEAIIRSAAPQAIITALDSEEDASRLMSERANIRDNFDFVIADIFLAGQGTGVDLWHKNRDNGTPFVFASVAGKSDFEQMVANYDGSDNESDGASLSRTRTPAFLQKPLDPNECARVIRNL